MLNYGAMVFDYEPFPIGVARPALDNGLYRRMVENFPPMDHFAFKADKGGKYSLSQVNNGGKYRRFVRGNPVWKQFHAFIKSPGFIDGALDMLKRNGLDLDLQRPKFLERWYLRARALQRGNPIPHFPKLKARFEFSGMPITGGNILPHTDNSKKLVTMVIPILHDNEWQDAWGGGTSVVWPKDKKKIFNRANAYLDFNAVDRLKTFPFEPNQCLVFIKTNNSWHAVWPMTGNDPSVIRKTLTINIESS